MRTAAPGEYSFVSDQDPLALPAAPTNGTTNTVVSTGGAAQIAASGGDTITSGASIGLTTLSVTPGAPQRFLYAAGVWYAQDPSLTDIAGAGSTGQVLTSNGAGGFSWQTPSGGGGAGAFVGQFAEAPVALTIFTAPTNWIPADGVAISRVRWALLWNFMGNPNTGDGAHTFNVPNRIDRFAVGSGNLYVPGQTGGAASVSVTISGANLPSSAPYPVSASDTGHSHASATGGHFILAGSTAVGGATTANLADGGPNTASGNASISASLGSNSFGGGTAINVATLPPYYAVQYLIYLGNPQGSTVAPTVTALSESSGFIGDLVTITGTAFDIATSVKFGTHAAVFTVVSNTSITATVPAGVTGTVDVTVMSDYGTSPTSPADQFTALVTPLQYVQDKSVTVSSGTTIPVTGLTATTSGNSVLIGMTSGDQTVSSIADNGSTHFTWSKVVSGATSSVDAEVWLGTGGIGATTVTVTLSGTTTSSRANASEWTGTLIADGAPANTHATSATLTSPTTTQSGTGGLFYAVGRVTVSDPSSGPTGTGWTALLPAVGTSGSTYAYLNSTDSANHNTTWGQASQAWESAGASFHV